MPKIFGWFVSASLALSFSVLSVAEARPAPDDEVTKDAKGRVVSRRNTNADHSSHRTSFQYGSDSKQPLVVVDEDLDPFGRVAKRVEQRFDPQGRALEKLDLRIDATGKQTGTRTRYHYDQSGRRVEEVTPVN